MTASKSTSTDELEQLQQEIVQLRRDLLRWKIVARQHKTRINEMESSASWRWTAALRMLSEVLRRWKLLLLLAIVVTLCLPLWPPVIVMLLFPRGRVLIWSLIWKIRPLHDLLSYMKQRIQAGGTQSRGKASVTAPLIFRRPAEAVASSTTNDLHSLRWHLMQQLCPQQRTLLEHFKLSQGALVNDLELPELHSLNSTEISILRITMRHCQSTVENQVQTP